MHAGVVRYEPGGFQQRPNRLLVVPSLEKAAGGRNVPCALHQSAPSRRGHGGGPCGPRAARRTRWWFTALRACTSRALGRARDRRESESPSCDGVRNISGSRPENFPVSARHRPCRRDLRRLAGWLGVLLPVGPAPRFGGDRPAVHDGEDRDECGRDDCDDACRPPPSGAGPRPARTPVPRLFLLGELRGPVEIRPSSNATTARHDQGSVLVRRCRLGRTCSALRVASRCGFLAAADRARSHQRACGHGRGARRADFRRSLRAWPFVRPHRSRQNLP